MLLIVRRVVVLLLPLHGGAVLAKGCSHDEDCNMCGRCDTLSSTCRCDAGWSGDRCERVNFGHSFPCGQGGLCLSGEQGFVSTWGGEAVQSDDGAWHLFAAGFAENTSLASWLKKSRVLHAVSAHNASGPYLLRDVSLGARSGWDGETQHNPAAVRAADGTYLLFYMGAQSQSVVANESLLPGVNSSYVCPMGSSTGAEETGCMQRIGLATATSPNGPWVRRDAPVLGAGVAGAWDDLFTTNPTPHVFRNGSVILVYKARSRHAPGVMRTGVAFAIHHAGPYRRLGGGPIALPGDCEDAGIYYSETMSVFRMILHCGCTYQTVWSRDGISWTRGAPPVDWCDVTYPDGRAERLARRERPKWLLDGQGTPTHLLNGVEPTVSHGKRTFTMLTAINP